MARGGIRGVEALRWGARGGTGRVGSSGGVSHEIHETTFMIGPIRPAARCGRMGVPGLFGRGVYSTRSIFMKWETPQATDFRFGMEITMYIAKR